MTRPRLLLDTLPLTGLLEGDKYLGWLVESLRRCGYIIAATEAVIVETLYFAEKSGADLAEAAAKLLSVLDEIQALRDEPLRSPQLKRLGYADTELLLSATRSNAVLVTGDERLALEARGHGVNSYAIAWLHSLEPEETIKLLCP